MRLDENNKILSMLYELFLMKCEGHKYDLLEHKSKEGHGT